RSARDYRLHNGPFVAAATPECGATLLAVCWPAVYRRHLLRACYQIVDVQPLALIPEAY
ncbi:jg25021, partial [Pararge aegeria aegeria]